MHFLDWIRQPWPWYISGPLIGLFVPGLLLLGNKTFGISSSLRHICAATIPAGISFFKYNWKKELWNLFFVAGVILGGAVVVLYLTNGQPVQVNPKLVTELEGYGVRNFSGTVPPDLFTWENLFTVKGFTLMIGGGFLVGFGTRYAGGCTSGHSIMGISNLQWPSLVATMCFMAGGFLVSNLVLPLLLKL